MSTEAVASQIAEVPAKRPRGRPRKVVPAAAPEKADVLTLKTALKGQPGMPSYRTAARWITQGLVQADGGGRGTPYMVALKQLHELRTLWALRQAGLSLQKLKRAAGNLEQFGYNPYSSGQFAVLDDGELVQITDAGEVVAWLKQPGQTLMRTLVRLPGDDAGKQFTCLHCGKVGWAHRSDRRYCSGRCRSAAAYARHHLAP